MSSKIINFKLRKAANTIQDIRSIANLISKASKLNLILPRSVDEITEVIDSFFVIDIKGEIVGCCSLEVYNKKLAELRSLCVAPQWQGNNFGRILVEQCVKSAKERGVYEVLTITDKVNFFKKLKFKKSLNGQLPMFQKLK